MAFWSLALLTMPGAPVPFRIFGRIRPSPRLPSSSASPSTAASPRSSTPPDRPHPPQPPHPHYRRHSAHLEVAQANRPSRLSNPQLGKARGLLRLVSRLCLSVEVRVLELFPRDGARQVRVLVVNDRLHKVQVDSSPHPAAASRGFRRSLMNGEGAY
eukprot:CAMPEP_0170575212 /NCGR_PEP_ID=MMETSP0224-20130122/3736_1 /TAXON_ID=285029 /ORGANISM="Togula jolla, Strain CCCM 725" /LENGTH=156 /DNA_ID=CAMNT_0010897967 /DNA_START=130 /DNA_END=598 /DNA_ORIENTATION=-